MNKQNWYFALLGGKRIGRNILVRPCSHPKNQVVIVKCNNLNQDHQPDVETRCV